MIDVFRKVFSLLDARERLRFLLLTVLMVIVALVEVAGVSSVLILLNVLANPSSITTNPWLAWAYGACSISKAISASRSPSPCL